MFIKLVLADDHPIFLDGLENLFRLEKDCRVLARCQNGEEALQALRKHRPDILILDMRMPAKNGLDVLREMNKEKLPARVVILAALLEEQEVVEAVRLGVSGIVLKEMASQLLLDCVRKVHAGGKWLESSVTSRALEQVVRREEGNRQVAQMLTSREMQILRMAALGLRNGEIGRKLFISEGTVKIHLHNIYAKLNVPSRLALTLYARDKGVA